MSKSERWNGFQENKQRQKRLKNKCKKILEDGKTVWQRIEEIKERIALDKELDL